MRILITNDDGIDSPGLKLLEQIASVLGETWVVAPHKSRSGCSHLASLGSPIEIRQIDARKTSVNGSPVDCVRIGHFALSGNLDWIFAGINFGANLGVDIYSSGTVAAAREGCILGVQALAISHLVHPSRDVAWNDVRDASSRLVRFAIARKCAAGSFWNLNVPLMPQESDQQVTICPVDHNPIPMSFSATSGEYVYSMDYHSRLYERGTDVDLCFAGIATASQISI